MELRTYLEILRRRRLLIVAATLIVAVVAGMTSSLKTPMYVASARVLLRPGDPSEQISQTQDGRGSADADRYLAAQLDVVESEAVASAVAQDVKGSSAKELLGQVSASQSGATDIVSISATDPDPARAAKVANVFAAAYIESRRVTAVAGLQKASDEIGVKLTELEDRIAELGSKIDDDTSAQEKANAKSQAKKPVAPTVAVTLPDGTVAQQPVTQPPIEDNFTPSQDEALSAARYAAAVQYQTLYSRQQELLVNKTLKKGEAELIAEAEVPTAPSSPQPKRDTVLGGIVGLLLGLGIAFVREQLDDRIHTREEAEHATNLTVLGELPADEEAARRPTEVAAHERPSGLLAEAARGLRTSLTFLGVDEPLRRIVVTSSGSGEGKSFVAANLAAVYAQAGMKTVLVSADLRKPRLDSLFPNITPGPGLSEVIAGMTPQTPSPNGRDLAGASALAQALRPTHIDGLSILPAGTLPPNPAELLGSKRASELLEQLTGLADMVIVDTPPILAVTDATVLAANVDGVIIVAAAGETHRGALTRAATTLGATHARILGVILNKTDPNGGSSYYGNYYGKYYGAYTTTPTKTSRLPWKRTNKTSPHADTTSR
jgi:polysaccharide biosynthesis transport protein